MLFIRAGKTKAVVEEFMELVGDDWMHHVEAVAMDMNSDFQEAFKAKCGWIQIVYDHFLWFARLIENHFDGIAGYGLYPISSGKIEGINAHIKVIRRKAYGLPDDEYFFLKIMDASRNPYKRI